MSVLILGYILIVNIRKSDEAIETPSEPLSLKSLGTSETHLELPRNLEISREYMPVHTVEETFWEDQIVAMMKELSLDLKKAEFSDLNYMEWSDSGNKFGYDSITNILFFELSEPIFLGEGMEALKTVFLQYFDKSYSFVLSKKETVNSNQTNYYAKRVVTDIPIEKGFGDEYTDIIKVNGSGYVIGGNILLTEFEQENTSVPIITEEELSQYINLDLYPKESYVYASYLMNRVDLSYLDSRWQDIHDSASNCNASGDIDLIYLYKSVNQDTLYPVFKILSNCEVEFEGEAYTVPAIFYVNAIDPEYVSIQ